MANNELMHYGVVGMKWGVRKSRPASLSPSPRSKKKSTFFTKKKPQTKPVAKQISKPTKTNPKQLTDEELKDRINRLELEKRYQDLVKSSEQVRTNNGKEFVLNIAKSSAENIGKQLGTYLLGELVNKAGKKFGVGDVVNPKKGQKDK